MGTTIAAKRTFWVRLICGLLVLAMGTVPLIVNWPYLFAGERDDLISAWLAVAAGAITVCVGIYLLSGPRTRGKASVLTRERWRYWYATVVFGVCVVLLVGALFLDQPTVSTGVPALLTTSPLLQLFVREGSDGE